MSDSSPHSSLASVRQSPSRPFWRDFLTPGWVITVLLIILFAFVALNYLAPWQLGKNARNNERNSRIDYALSQETEPLGHISSVPEDKDWTPITMRGRFLPEKQALLRNRPVDNAPAFQVLTVFETEEGVSLIVNRGWHPPEGTTGIPKVLSAPEEILTLSGYLRKEEPTPRLEPVHDRGVAEVFGINSEHFTKATGAEVIEGYVQLNTDSVQKINGDEERENSSMSSHAESIDSEKLLALPLPEKVSGPYLSYGIQWILFGILAPVGLIYFIRAELKERRKEEEERRSIRNILEDEEAQDKVSITQNTVSDNRNTESLKPELQRPNERTHEKQEDEEIDEDSVRVNQEQRMAQRYGREGSKMLRRNKRQEKQRF